MVRQEVSWRVISRHAEHAKPLVERTMEHESRLVGTGSKQLITRRSWVQIPPPLRRRPLGHPHIPRVFSRPGLIASRYLTGFFRVEAVRSTVVEERSEGICGLCLHAREDVLVGGHRERPIRVAKTVRHNREGYTFFEQQRSVGVAQIVEADLGERGGGNGSPLRIRPLAVSQPDPGHCPHPCRAVGQASRIWHTRR